MYTVLYEYPINQAYCVPLPTGFGHYSRCTNRYYFQLSSMTSLKKFDQSTGWTFASGAIHPQLVSWEEGRIYWIANSPTYNYQYQYEMIQIDEKTFILLMYL